MSDDALRELLASPLEDRPRRAPEWARLAALGVAAAVVGFLATVGLSLLVGGHDADASAGGSMPTGETTATTVAAPPEVADGLTLQPAWIMERGGSIFVGVHLLQAPGSDPDVPEAAAWALRTEAGRYVGYLADHSDPVTPGVFTIEFPALGVDVDEIETLLVRPSIGSRELTATWDLDLNELPWAGPAPGPIIEDENVTFRATKIRLADNGGYVEWSMFGASGQRAVVEATAVWTVPGSDEIRKAVPEDQLPGVPLQRGAVMGGATSTGTVALYRLDDPEEPTFRSRWWGEPGPVEIEALRIDWRAVVFEYPEAGIEVPLTGVPVIEG